jgi:hypothetical protein
MATRTAPNRQTHVESLPLFLVTLTRNIKSQEIFKTNSLNHIFIKTELYRAQTGLTQGYNCQSLGHALANCKQPPRRLWCNGGHLHMECPEKTNIESMPSCRNCTLGGGTPHPASYQGCSHAKAKLQRRRAQRAPNESTGRMLFSKFPSSEQFYTAALVQNTQHQQPQAPQIYGKGVWLPMKQHLLQQEIQRTGLSVQAPNSSNNDMLKVDIVVQQIIRAQ